MHANFMICSDAPKTFLCYVKKTWFHFFLAAAIDSVTVAYSASVQSTTTVEGYKVGDHESCSVTSSTRLHSILSAGYLHYKVGHWQLASPISHEGFILHTTPSVP